MTFRFTVFLLALVGASAAHAQNSALGVNLKAGTAGTGFDLVMPINEGLNLRLGHANYSADREVTEKNVNYQAQLNLGGTNVLADWFPSKSSRFRWTLGAYSPKYQLTGQARPGEGGTIEINNVAYPAAALGTLDLSVKWGGVKPYLGLGFDGFRHAKAGLYFNVDAGVILAGSPKVSLNANCPSAEVCAAIESDLRAEEAQLDADFQKLKYLPVVQVGVGYRF
jgi:hypothetical protein